jgi:hypothetical protein
MYLQTNGVLNYGTAGAVKISSSTGAITLGTWTHIAVSKVSGNTKMFINGSQVGSTYSDSNDYGSSARFVNGTYGDSPGATNNNGGVISGYISNLRILNGTGLYAGSYTVPTAPLTAITNTSCLTYQSNRWIDNSTNNISITPSGTPSVQRFSPFNPTAPYSTTTIGGSGYFDGSTAYLTAPDNAAFDMGSGNYTIEFWFYATASVNCSFITKRASNGSYAPVMVQWTSGNNLLMYSSTTGSSWAVNTSTGSYPLNTWNHVAMVRNGTAVTLYVNGVSAATGSESGAVMTNTSPFVIGADDASGNNKFAGYMSDVRVVKGTAVYTTTFTPPTSPETAISGTSLLTNMTNAGIPDLAMQNNLQTVGSAQVSTSVVKYGTGSLSFNGSSDYLSAPDSPVYTLGSGDFTIEGWFYSASFGSGQFVISQWNSASYGYAFSIANSTTIKFEYYSGGSYYNRSYTISTLSTNTWYHIAWVRSSGTTTVYINGVASGTPTSDNRAITDSTRPLLIGINGDGNNQYFNGYIDDLRITNGYARYTSNFTPPTSALPTY